MQGIYPMMWPEYSIIEVDTLTSDLARQLDISGVDKILFARNGHIVQVAQRFREARIWQNPRWREFTIRESEMSRHKAAICRDGAVPTFYVYGYATENEQDFLRLFIVRYREWLEGIGQDHNPYFKETAGLDQENFWCESWTGAMPAKYIAFAYPQLSFGDLAR